MIAQRTLTTTNTILHEAAKVLNQYHASRVSSASQWACENCGMLHHGSFPDSCDSCGVSDTFTKLQNERTEIGSRW